MKRHLVWVVLLLATSCKHCDRTGRTNPNCPVDDATCVAMARPLAADVACPEDQWVGLQRETRTSCPTVQDAEGGRWLAQPLFAGKNVAPALSRFCVYSWQPSAADSKPDVRSLQQVQELSSLAPDCRAVVGSSTPAVLATWQTLRKSFLNQADALAPLPEHPKVRPSPVRVAVVDDSPDGYNKGLAIDGQFGHGMTVGRIIRELACPNPGRSQPAPSADLSCEEACGEPSGARACGCDAACSARGDCCADYAAVCKGEGGACVAKVSSHLALPLEDAATPNPAQGGRLGTQADLARAIKRALEAWLPHRSAQPHLIVNLSLGWDARFGGRFEGEAAELGGPVQAVHAVLSRAACLGALVVAAAGNDAGGAYGDQGPLYPAAWETQPMPTAERCAQLGVTSGETGPKPSGAKAARRPLLFSVGGLLGNDEALPIGRQGGRSRLAAPAAHGVAVRYDQGSPAPTRVLSGTSVATAVLSGIAATAWAYRPDLDAGQVIDLLYASATPLGTPADYCMGGDPCPLPASTAEIRRVGLCAALGAACAAGGSACPQASELGPCTGRPAFADARPVLGASELAAVAAASTGSASASSVTQTLPPLAVCGPPVIVHDSLSVYPDPTCPARQYYGPALALATFPQPGAGSCPNCTLQAGFDVPPTGKLEIQIDPGFQGDLQNPTLSIDRTHILVLPSMTLSAGDAVTITDISLPTAAVSSAELAFSVVEPGTSTVIGSDANVLLVQE